MGRGRAARGAPLEAGHSGIPVAVRRIHRLDTPLHDMVSPDVVVAPDGETATAFWIDGTYDGALVKQADGSWHSISSC